MRLSCRRARALLVDNVRGAVPETALLQLDLHLVDCSACRTERARVSTLAALRDWSPAGLGAAARARIVANLAAAPMARAVVSAPPRRAPRRLAFAGLATAALAAMLILVARHPRPATTRFADAELRYGRGARVALRPETRTVALDRGELEVRAHGAPVRVATRHLVVTVSGRALFAGEQIRVSSGAIVVFDEGMHELATLGPGDAWPRSAVPSLPAPASPPPPPVAAPSPAPAATKAPSAPARAASADDVGALLDHARAALAAGDAAAARRFAHRAFDAAATARRRAEAELFLAESYLVDHDADRAVTVYRQVALSFPRSAEGESAAFAAAEVLYERHRVAEAREALQAYVARYPDGRFAREATDRLAALSE